MPVTITPVAGWSPISAPANGDPASGAIFQAAPQALANQLALVDQVVGVQPTTTGTGVRRVQTVTTTTALKSIPAPVGGDLCILLDTTYDPVGLFVFRPAFTGSDVTNTSYASTTATGMWQNVAFGGIGNNPNGPSVLDNNGRLPLHAPINALTAMITGTDYSGSGTVVTGTSTPTIISALWDSASTVSTSSGDIVEIIAHGGAGKSGTGGYLFAGLSTGITSAQTVSVVAGPFTVYAKIISPGGTYSPNLMGLAASGGSISAAIASISVKVYHP